MTIDIAPRTLFGAMLKVMAVLVAGHIAVWTADVGFGRDALAGIRGLLDLDAEQSVGTLVQSLQLGLAAVLLALIASDARRQHEWGSRYWMGLSAIFGFLMVDESCSIHELLTAPLRSGLHVGGLLYYAWVIAYVPLVGVFGLTYLRFWWRLPGDLRLMLATSAAVYLAGAVGLEMVGGSIASSVGRHTWAYAFETTLEEGLEMLGMALVVRTLAAELRARAVDTVITFGSGVRSAASPQSTADVTDHVCPPAGLSLLPVLAIPPSPTPGSPHRLRS